ncbi:MAG TPA: metal-dependent phosphohydrolase [Chloroflexi bacterium]|jgi:putative two-component system response regulator|nr:metal-dependent phosphohydrolase [Chloroflexota bacterium]
MWAERDQRDTTEVQASVLLVDDDRLNVELLMAFLEGEGYRVAAAFNGVEALKAVAAAPPDLIFLDAIMPGMDGFDVCKELKDNPDTRLIPVVIVTALSASEDRIHGIEVGADDFLSKPINRQEFVLRARSLVRVKRYVDELESAERVILALSKAIEARDGYTEKHMERVTRGAVALGERIGLPEGLLQVLYQGGMLHDVGKIGIPEAILGKPGPLTDQEFALMRRHPEIGVEICRPLRSSLVAQTLPIIRHHHERADGQGYPDGLAGEDIPLLARIMSISDAYDAMISDRPYRRGMLPSSALDELRAGAGTQWDRELVGRFLSLEGSTVLSVSQEAE